MSRDADAVARQQVDTALDLLLNKDLPQYALVHALLAIEARLEEIATTIGYVAS